MKIYDVTHTKSEYRSGGAALLVENSKVVILSKPEEGKVLVCKFGSYRESLVVPISILDHAAPTTF